MAETLGEHVKRRRKALGITSQKALAAKLKWHQTYISHIERDRAKRPSFALLVQLAKALHEDVFELLADTGLIDMYAADVARGPLSSGQELLIDRVAAHFAGLDVDVADRAWRVLETAVGELRPSRQAPALLEGPMTQTDVVGDEPPAP